MAVGTMTFALYAVMCVMTSPGRELVLTEQANMRVEKVCLYSPFDETEFKCPLKISGEWLLSNQ